MSVRSKAGTSLGQRRLLGGVWDVQLQEMNQPQHGSVSQCTAWFPLDSLMGSNGGDKDLNIFFKRVSSQQGEKSGKIPNKKSIRIIVFTMRSDTLETPFYKYYINTFLL